MKRALIILIGFLIAACSDNDLKKQSHTVAYFEQHLKVEMKYADIEKTFGEPDDDIGSGIHIYQYDLEDGTKVYIGFADKIMYANHVDANNTLIKVLL